MQNKIQLFFIRYTKICLALVFVGVSVLSGGGIFAQDARIPVDGTGGGTRVSELSEKATNTGFAYVCQGGLPGECTFEDLVSATKRIVGLFTRWGLILSVVVIAYAGYLYMMSGENPSKRGEANKMLLKVVQGIALLMGAWLIVNLVLNALVKDEIRKTFPI